MHLRDAHRAHRADRPGARGSGRDRARHRLEGRQVRTSRRPGHRTSDHRARPRQPGGRGAPGTWPDPLRRAVSIVPEEDSGLSQGGLRMKPRVFLAILALSCLPEAAAAQAPAGGWDAVDKVFGSPGKDQPGDVRRYGWPRTDPHVVLGGVPVEPALALGGWAAFTKTGPGPDAV